MFSVHKLGSTHNSAVKVGMACKLRVERWKQEDLRLDGELRPAGLPETLDQIIENLTQIIEPGIYNNPVISWGRWY